jgi:hypothetical protein
MLSWSVAWWGWGNSDVVAPSSRVEGAAKVNILNEKKNDFHHCKF